MEMLPPKEHIHLLLSVSAGMFITLTWALPGAQGAAITGTHGIGVSTPMAAEVAEATVGLDSDWHIPNVGMFAGVKSIVVAINMFIHLGRRGTVTISEQGVIPKLHWSIAPIVTKFPIFLKYYKLVTHQNLLHAFGDLHAHHGQQPSRRPYPAGRSAHSDSAGRLPRFPLPSRPSWCRPDPDRS